MSTTITFEEAFRELIDRISILQKNDAISKQNQYRLEKKIDELFDFVKDRKRQERERGIKNG